MKLIWLTDIHLNFLDSDSRKVFYQTIVQSNGDMILISGDIAEAPSVIALLDEMVQSIQKPIYFVLGNHDYYRGQIDEVREAMVRLTNKKNKLYWLPAVGIKKLNNDTILLGQDGWADGRLGDYANSQVALVDSRLIADLFQAKIMGKFHLLDKMQQLADKDAAALQESILEAIGENPKRIVILTHVPPFEEACLYNGKISADDWLPYFSSKATGDVLISAAKENKHIQFLVLCGHTHGEANYQALGNLLVRVGKAEYSHPQIQNVLLMGEMK